MPDFSDQWDFTAPFEGIIPHIYLDSRGNPTCGVGFLIVNEADLARLPWSPNVQAAIADLRCVSAAPAGRVASAYAPLCKARLPEPAMRLVFADKVAAVRREMGDWHLATHPEPVQIALVDMGYNLGAFKLRRDFPKLKRLVDARDYRGAAAECHRAPPVSESRNDATRGLFLSAAVS